MIGCISKQTTDIWFTIGTFFIIFSIGFVIFEYVAKSNIEKWKIAAAFFATSAALIFPHSSYGYRCSDSNFAAVSDVFSALSIVVLIVSLVKK